MRFGGLVTIGKSHHGYDAMLYDAMLILIIMQLFMLFEVSRILECDL